MRCSQLSSVRSVDHSCWLSRIVTGMRAFFSGQGPDLSSKCPAEVLDGQLVSVVKSSRAGCPIILYGGELKHDHLALPTSYASPPSAVHRTSTHRSQRVPHALTAHCAPNSMISRNSAFVFILFLLFPRVPWVMVRVLFCFHLFTSDSFQQVHNLENATLVQASGRSYHLNVAKSLLTTLLSVSRC